MQYPCRFDSLSCTPKVFVLDQRDQIRHTLRIVHAKALQRQPVFEEIAAQNRVANRDHRINVRRWHPDNLAQVRPEHQPV